MRVNAERPTAHGHSQALGCYGRALFWFRALVRSASVQWRSVGHSSRPSATAPPRWSPDPRHPASRVRIACATADTYPIAEPRAGRRVTRAATRPDVRARAPPRAGRGLGPVYGWVQGHGQEAVLQREVIYVLDTSHKGPKGC